MNDPFGIDCVVKETAPAHGDPRAGAERWRPRYLRDMLGLEVGQRVEIYPDADDTIDALWVRLRRQAARYKLAGRHYHLNKHHDYVLVRRVPNGQSGKLARFRRMSVGEKLLCLDPFDSSTEKRNLRRRLYYLWKLGSCIWLERHRDGRLYYRCVLQNRPPHEMWSTCLYDDGSDLSGIEVVSSYSTLRDSQAEFARTRALLLRKRAENA
jgi:bifunctional DNA-binding transcriptional regulator/antitoxin component of YhaV-PrlF toxin-antitoxin module